MEKTMVLVIEYPDSMRKRLENKLKPVVVDVNTNYGEVWQPYDGVRSDELADVLENLESEVTMRKIIKQTLVEGKEVGKTNRTAKADKA